MGREHGDGYDKGPINAEHVWADVDEFSNLLSEVDPDLQSILEYIDSGVSFDASYLKLDGTNMPSADYVWDIDLDLTSGYLTADNLIAKETGGDTVTIAHDGSHGNITSSAGYLRFIAAANIQFSQSGITPVLEAFWSGSTYSGLAMHPDWQYRGNRSYDQLILAMASAVGRQIIYCDYEARSSDFDHAPQDNPTLYVHSVTNPNTANDEWISLTHNVTDAVIDWGSGKLNLDGGDIQIGSGAAGTTGRTITMASETGSNTIRLMEGSGDVYGFSLGYNSSNNFEMYRHDNSQAGTQILNIARSTGTWDFQGNDLTTTGLGTLGSLVVDTNTLVANVSGYENRVGVGTATPFDTLHVLKSGGSTNLTTKFENTNAGKASYLTLESDSGYNSVRLVDSDGNSWAFGQFGVSSEFKIQDTTTGTQRVIIKAGGNNNGLYMAADNDIALGEYRPLNRLDINTAGTEKGLRLTNVYNSVYADLNIDASGNLIIGTTGGTIDATANDLTTTGIGTFGNGTAGVLAGIGFASDPDTGLVKTASGEVGLMGNGYAPITFTGQGLLGYTSFWNTGSDCLFNAGIDDFMYKADVRFGVTQTNFTSAVTASLFDLDYEESTSNKIAAHTDAVINIDLTDKGIYSRTYGLVYSYGYFYLTFYGSTGTGEDNLSFGVYSIHREYDVTADSSTDTFTRASHVLGDDDLVKITADGTQPTGIDPDTYYYVINKTTDTFQISATEGGAAVDFSSNGADVQFSEVHYSTTVKKINSTGKPIYRLSVPTVPYAIEWEIHIVTDDEAPQYGLVGIDMELTRPLGTKLAAVDKFQIQDLYYDWTWYDSSYVAQTVIGILGITTVNLDVDTLNLNGNVISDSTGTISFSNENLTTTGDIRLVSDSSRLEIGGLAGGDMALYHNGTDSYMANLTGTLYIDGTGTSITLESDVLVFGDGTNDTIVTHDGGTNDGIYRWMEDEDYFRFDDDVFFNKAMYKDINLGAAQLSKPASSQPDTASFLDEAGADTGIETLAFAIGEKIHGSFEMQHDYDEGTDFVFHIHWQGITAPSGTDNVRWRLTYTFGVDSATLDATTVVDSADTPFDTQYEFVRTDVVTISGTNRIIGDQFLFTLERVAAAGDAYVGDALISTVGIHYEVNTLGSRQIGTK